MGQISGTYTGPSVSFFDLEGSSSQSGGSLGGGGASSYGYTIFYTDNGFTDAGWTVNDRTWTIEELSAQDPLTQFKQANYIEDNYPSGCASTYYIK